MRIWLSSLDLFNHLDVYVTCTDHGHAGSSFPTEDEAFPPQTGFALAITAGPRSNMIRLKQMYVELRERLQS